MVVMRFLAFNRKSLNLEMPLSLPVPAPPFPRICYGTALVELLGDDGKLLRKVPFSFDWLIPIALSNEPVLVPRGAKGS